MDDELRAAVRAEAQKMISEGDFMLPGGIEPGAVLEDHRVILENQDHMMDALYGEFAAPEYPGAKVDRDFDTGLMYLVHEHHNGGLNVRMPWQFYTTAAAILATMVVGFTR